MRSKLVVKVNIVDELLIMMLLVCTNKWVFEGVLRMSILETVFLGLGIGIALYRSRLQLSKASFIWLIYLVSIVFSASIHSSSISVWRKVSVFGMLCLIPVTFGCQKVDLDRIMKALIRIAIFHSIFILLQFLLKDSFNNLYFPMLGDGARASARYYYRHGYYFGLLYSPHELAGILGFSVGYLLFRNIIDKRKFRDYLLAIFLFAVMLLTGKRGTVLVAVLAFVLALLLLYESRRQLLRIIPVLLILVAGLAFLRFYILSHTDTALFYRFAKMLQSLSTGGRIDTGRFELYQIARTQWQTHKALGIGWFHFVELTLNVYGYNLAHQVNMDYLQWLCELGVFGFVLNLIPVLVTFLQTIVVGRRGDRLASDSNEQTRINFIVFVQIYTVIYAFVEVPFYDIFYFYMYMLSCMIVNNYYFKRLKRGRNTELRSAKA